MRFSPLGSEHVGRPGSSTTLLGPGLSYVPPAYYAGFPLASPAGNGSAMSKNSAQGSPKPGKRTGKAGAKPASTDDNPVHAQLNEIKARLERLESTASRWKNWPTRLHRAQHLLAARRHRDSLFGEGLFGEPGWDIVLELYVAGMRHTRYSLSKVGGNQGLPSTTVLRWINKLEEVGLVYREPDPTNGRRVFVMLTDRGFDLMSAHLDALADVERESVVREDD